MLITLHMSHAHLALRRFSWPGVESSSTEIDLEVVELAGSWGKVVGHGHIFGLPETRNGRTVTILGAGSHGCGELVECVVGLLVDPISLTRIPLHLFISLRLELRLLRLFNLIPIEFILSLLFSVIAANVLSFKLLLLSFHLLFIFVIYNYFFYLDHVF